VLAAGGVKAPDAAFIGFAVFSRCADDGADS